MNGLLFRGAELTLPEIKRMDRCSAPLALRGQATGCQIKKQGKNETKNSPSLCSEAATALASIRSILGVEGYIPAERPVPRAVLSSGEQGVCVPVRTVHLATCAHRPVFASESHCSVLVTLLWWIAEHWTCVTRCLLLPSACPSPSLVKSLTLSSAFCALQLCTGWSSLEATFDTNSQENLCDGPKEAPLHVCPVAALSLCFPGVRDSCLLPLSLQLSWPARVQPRSWEILVES